MASGGDDAISHDAFATAIANRFGEAAMRAILIATWQKSSPGEPACRWEFHIEE
jgi:hypothetical protein